VLTYHSGEVKVNEPDGAIAQIYVSSLRTPLGAEEGRISTYLPQMQVGVVG